MQHRSEIIHPCSVNSPKGTTVPNTGSSSCSHPTSVADNRRSTLNAPMAPTTATIGRQPTSMFEIKRTLGMLLSYSSLVSLDSFPPFNMIDNNQWHVTLINTFLEIDKGDTRPKNLSRLWYIIFPLPKPGSISGLWSNRCTSTRNT